MIILDGNILEGQRRLLGVSRIAPRQIGVDVGRKGMKDDEVAVFLCQQRHVTFFTRDADFCVPELRHGRYCLAVLDVRQNETATFVRRFLHHPDFDTQVKRMGRVVRVSHAGLAVRRLRSQTEIHTVWNRSG